MLDYNLTYLKGYIMIENTGLLFGILGVVAVLFVVAESMIDVDSFAGRFISKMKGSKPTLGEEA